MTVIPSTIQKVSPVSSLYCIKFYGAPKVITERFSEVNCFRRQWESNRGHPRIS